MGEKLVLQNVVCNNNLAGIKPDHEVQERMLVMELKLLADHLSNIGRRAASSTADWRVVN